MDRSRYIPDPFVIAVGLTLLTFLLAIGLTLPSDIHLLNYSIDVISFWKSGFWDLLAFSMQMMLILILGHILALTPVVDRLIKSSLSLCKSNAHAAFYICLFTLVAAFVNWGLGLIFGAIMCRKVAAYAAEKGIAINYPLLGAAGYSGLMVWHGGFSGSAPLTVMTSGHFLESSIGLIPATATILSPMNMIVSLALLIILPVYMYWMGKRVKCFVPERFSQEKLIKEQEIFSGKKNINPLAVFFGGLILLAAVIHAINAENGILYLITLNYVNFILFGAGLLLMGSFARFTGAAGQAIRGGTGIMIQFPLYAGIMGIMRDSGLLAKVTDLFINHSNETFFPILTFLSAAIVNIFVPSGGGQWAVQGPLITEAAAGIGVEQAKAVMALAYGDQITNMIQPFWALPLLGITGLRASELLPHTFRLMLLGMGIYLTALIVI